MIALHEFIKEAMKNKAKSGGTLLDRSSGNMWCGLEKDINKFLDTEKINSEYMKKSYRELELEKFGGNWINPIEGDSLKLLYILLDETHYDPNNWEKMGKEMKKSISDFVTKPIYKIHMGEPRSSWKDHQGAIHFEIYFNRVAKMIFTFTPSEYVEVEYDDYKELSKEKSIDI